MADQELDGITLRTILDHMRAMETRMTTSISSVDQRLQRLEQKVDQRMQKLEQKIDLLFVQNENIDERLDDIEVVQLPAIRQKIMMV